MGENIPFSKTLLNCNLLSQAIELLDGQTDLYEESIENDVTRVRLEANGTDTIWFAREAFWPKPASSESEGEHQHEQC